MAHQNNTFPCPGCLKLFKAYESFHPVLEDWFWRTLRKKNLEVHISCAGRGYNDQEAAFSAKKSRAHYGESAHNYGLALDLFRLRVDGTPEWDPAWFDAIVSPFLLPELLWYGNEGPYREWPHVEMRNWKALTEHYPLVE